jgi:uncharacterized protein (TIGR02271 family)
MITTQQIDALAGATVIGEDGSRIGKVGQVYLDDQSGAPQWVTVSTGLFGTSESFVPLEAATLEGDDLRVPYSKDLVKDAPRVDPDGHLEESEEARLYEHYGLTSGTAGVAGTGMDDVTGVDDVKGGHAGQDVPTGTTTDTTAGGYVTGGTTTGHGLTGDATVGRDTSGPTTDSAMTRSEEELQAGTRTQESGRARLRKYVVTEQQTTTVPVSREEVRVEREPITEGNVDAALDGPAISEEEHEVVLHEEVPVVTTEARPVERVRLDTETVTEQQTVTGDVRKEQIEIEGDDTGRGATP